MTTPARILIVDDDEHFLLGMREWLEAAGYEATTVKTLGDGRRAILDVAPHLVILDVRLGPANGLQLISTGALTLPVIVVTGYDDPVLRADTTAFGARYLLKPVDPHALLAIIEEHLTSTEYARN